MSISGTTHSISDPKKVASVSSEYYSIQYRPFLNFIYNMASLFCGGSNQNGATLVETSSSDLIISKLEDYLIKVLSYGTLLL